MTSAILLTKYRIYFKVRRAELVAIIEILQSSCDIAYSTSGLPIHMPKYIFPNWLADVKYIV